MTVVPGPPSHSTCPVAQVLWAVEVIACMLRQAAESACEDEYVAAELYEAVDELRCRVYRARREVKRLERRKRTAEELEELGARPPGSLRG